MTMTSDAGGKAAGLEMAEQTGLSVPPWTVVPAEVFTGWARRAGLLDTADGAEEPRLLARAKDCALTGAEVETIDDAYRGLGAERVAVRSSGLEEDGASHSHAGVYLTELNVATTAEVVDAVHACWASAFAPRALSYRTHRTGEPLGAGMAVVLQVMVAAERSGVLFTQDPGDRRRAVVSAVYGLGEGLVSGTVDADTTYVDRDSGAVLDTHRGLKEEAVVSRADGSGVDLDPVAATRGESLALTEDEITEIWRAGRTLEARAGCPQDVEWAYDADGKLWILQSRPITTIGAAADDDTAVSTSDGTLRIWDNSNIIESFGAVTLPLTFSFAQHVYHRVYHEYARLLRVPGHELATMDSWLRSMLGWFDGHVYYNLLNWYKVIRLLPFYRTNRTVLELQMGLSEPLPDELAMDQQPLTSPTRAVRTWIAANFVRHFLGMHRSAAGFVRYFDQRFRAFEDELDVLESMDSARILDRYQNLEEDLLRRFGRMILLEATIALSYGAFQTLVERWAPDTPGWARWDAVRPRRPMASSTAVETLERIATHVRGLRPAVRAALEQQDIDHHAALRELGETELLGMVDAFIAAYGYRSANELKLEAPDMRDDPEIFFALLRGCLDVETQQERPDAKPARFLGGVRGWVLERVRRKAQVSLEDREDVRFCRSRAFGMVRRMVTAIGADLTRMGALADPSDVFYLELGELEKYVRGAATASELAPLVALRRERFDGFSRTPGAPRFTTRGVPYWGQSDDGYPRSAKSRPDAEDGVLHGIGCVPGVAEGPAAVVTEPRDVDGGILVTYRTDPGWITALPTARGLVIERGSPLTHVAIAAREFGIPTVVQVPGVTTAVASGDRIRIDGERGTVTMKGEES
jgi:pyruvate,water dikinase